jgi:hypothetical protein
MPLCRRALKTLMNCESRSDNTEDIESASDDSERVKVVARAATAGITYDFGVSGVAKARVTSRENNARYFPKSIAEHPTWSRCRSLSRMRLLYFKTFL